MYKADKTSSNMEFLETTSCTKVKAWLSLNEKWYKEANISSLPNEVIANYFNFTSFCELELCNMWIENPQKKIWTCCVCNILFNTDDEKFDWKIRLVHSIRCFHEIFACDTDEPFIMRVKEDVTLVVHPRYMEYHTMGQENRGIVRNLPRLKITDNFSEIQDQI